MNETLSTKISKAILIYLRTRVKDASVSEIFSRIGLCYVENEKPSCYVADEFNRFEVKRALHALDSKGYVKLIGGHNWMLTETGELAADLLIK